MSSERDRLIRSNSEQDADQKAYEIQSLFYWLFALVQGIGLVCIIIVVIWVEKYLGGFAWDGSGQMFNWHPVLMVTGMVYLYGNAVIVYRVLQAADISRLKVKLLHAGLHTTALIVTVVGLFAAFGFHNANDIPNLYSLHSWIGITTVILFAFQILVGFLAFLFPKFSEEWRQQYLTMHVYFGGIIFIFSVIACISGITEKLLFAFRDTYSQFSKPTMIANALGIFIIMFAMLIGYMLNKETS